MGQICGRRLSMRDCAPWPFGDQAGSRLTGGGARPATGRDPKWDSRTRAAKSFQPGLPGHVEHVIPMILAIGFQVSACQLLLHERPWLRGVQIGRQMRCYSAPSVIRAKHIRPCFLLCALRYPQHVAQKIWGAILALSNRGACSSFVARFGSRAENTSDSRQHTTA